MAYRTALLIALLVAASQAAPQGQVQGTVSQQNSSSIAGSASGSAGSGSGSIGAQSGSGTSSGSGSSTGSLHPIVLPNFSNLFPSFNFTGSFPDANAQSPVAAIISTFPSAINAERDRVSNAVQQLISQQVEAASDSIGAAAQTGGKIASDGVKVIASWPTFWANLLG